MLACTAQGHTAKQQSALADPANQCLLQVVPRNDTLAGPKGRRGDQVGGYTLMHTADLRRVAPGWVTFSEDVRADPDVSPSIYAARIGAVDRAMRCWITGDNSAAFSRLFSQACPEQLVWLPLQLLWLAFTCLL